MNKRYARRIFKLVLRVMLRWGLASMGTAVISFVGYLLYAYTTGFTSRADFDKHSLENAAQFAIIMERLDKHNEKLDTINSSQERIIMYLLNSKR